MSQSNFDATSRYYYVGTAERTMPDGKTIVYVRRRFVPPPENFTQIGQHMVSEGDRIDTIAAKYLGDPEAFWRICDANCAMDPNELTEISGDAILITLPEGIPGYQHG